MKRAEIEQMAAGPAMDEAVGKALGWKYRKDIERWVQQGDPMAYFALPAYSTDIAAAWQVVDALRYRCISLGIHPTPDSFNVGDMLNGRHIVNAETAPLAICRAALLALLPAHD